jgi:hypothetical protein
MATTATRYWYISPGSDWYTSGGFGWYVPGALLGTLLVQYRAARDRVWASYCATTSLRHLMLLLDVEGESPRKRGGDPRRGDPRPSLYNSPRNLDRRIS